MEFSRTCYLQKHWYLHCSIFWWLTGLWVKGRHRDKSTGSKSNPVQSSTSGKGHLLRFQLNSTATSDGWVQQLVINLWHDFELIATSLGYQVAKPPVWAAVFSVFLTIQEKPMAKPQAKLLWGYAIAVIIAPGQPEHMWQSSSARKQWNSTEGSPTLVPMTALGLPCMPINQNDFSFTKHKK